MTYSSFLSFCIMLVPPWSDLPLAAAPPPCPTGLLIAAPHTVFEHAVDFTVHFFVPFCPCWPSWSRCYRFGVASPAPLWGAPSRPSTFFFVVVSFPHHAAGASDTLSASPGHLPSTVSLLSDSASAMGQADWGPHGVRRAMRNGHRIPSPWRATCTVDASSVFGAIGEPPVCQEELNGVDYSSLAVAGRTNFSFEGASGILPLGCRDAQVVAASTDDESPLGTTVRYRIGHYIVGGFQVPARLCCHRSPARSTTEERYFICLIAYLRGPPETCPFQLPASAARTARY